MGIETVCVACKLPNGVVLRAFDMRPATEPMPGGGSRDIMRAVEIPNSRVTINGIATPFGVPHPYPVSSGFALTFGVPKAIWDAWLRDNSDSAMVEGKMIFAYATRADVEAAARENEARRPGLEPIDPDNPPKEFAARPRSPLGGVQKATPGMS
jgi:hypothetical protein